MDHNHRIFISYSSEDQKLAFNLCDFLESNGIDCWIAPRNIQAGEDYSAEIVAAIKQCQALLLIFSENANVSRHVASEIDRAFNHSIPIIPFKIGEFKLSNTFEYYLSKCHWIASGERIKESFPALLKNCQLALNISTTTEVEKPSQTTIQSIDHQYIIVNINSKEYTISKSFEQFSQLLNENHSRFFTYLGILYNIADFTENSFDLLTGTTPFNQFLTQSIIESIKSECVPAQRFYEKASTIPKWQTQLRISDKAKEIISYSFVGIIGKELSKLMAIGKEEFSEQKLDKYIHKCINIARRSLDLVNYTLLSKLWDVMQVKQIILNDLDKTVLAFRFESLFEPDIREQLTLLYTLIGIFGEPENQMLLPIPELSELHQNRDKRKALDEACDQLQKLSVGKFDILDGYEAERSLAVFLSYFSFLVSYQMASVKKIGYRQIKNFSPGFIHRYVALGIDNKANVDAEKVDYAQDATYSDSVLFFKGNNYKESVNLFPFIIDYNAITFEQGSRICFFRAMALSDDRVEFAFLDDNSVVQLIKSGVMKQTQNLNDFLLNEENLKLLNIECVVDRLNEARRCILGEPDFENL